MKNFEDLARDAERREHNYRENPFYETIEIDSPSTQPLDEINYPEDKFKLYKNSLSIQEKELITLVNIERELFDLLFRDDQVVFYE